MKGYLGQLTEVPVADVPGDAVVRLVHVLAHKVEGVGRGQQRKQLVLLGLVVQDLGLWFPGERRGGGEGGWMHTDKT